MLNYTFDLGQAKPVSTKILFLGANPLRQKNLKLERECFEISERLRQSNPKRRFELESHMFTRRRDFMDSISDERPSILHFSGHGSTTTETIELLRTIGYINRSSKGGLIVHDRDYQAVESLNTDDLDGIFENFVVNQQILIEIVLLNACYSSNQAKAIAKYVKYVIGMKNAIRDDDSIEFSYAFYGSLVRGETPLQAYHNGRVAIPAKAQKLLTIFIDGAERKT